MELARSGGFRHASQIHVERIIRDAVTDTVIVFAAYYSALFLRAIATPVSCEQGLRITSYAICVHVSVLFFLGAYRRLWAKTSGHSIIVLFNAAAASTAILLLSDLMLAPRPVPLSVITLGSLFSHLGFTAVRYRSRLLTGFAWRWQAVWNYRFPKTQTRVLIIGAGDSGQILAWRLKYRAPEQMYHVIGFVDDDPSKLGMNLEGCRVLGMRHDIEHLVKQYWVDLIVVSIRHIDGADMRDILSHCESTSAMIKVVPDIFDVVNSTSHVPELRDVRTEDFIGRSIITNHEGIDLAPMTRKSLLVTGAAGSIGSELSRQLAQFDPTKLLLLDNNESGLHDLSVELCARFPQLHVIPILADITVTEQVWPVFQQYRPQVVFHAAAYKHVPMLERYPNEGIRNNIQGTWQLAELARAHGVERFVLISTDKAVNPTSVMGSSKRACELILHALSEQNNHRTLFTAVRFGNVLGSRGSVVPTFARQINNGGPVTVTDARMTRYFMSIPEAVDLVINAACITHGDDIFVLKMGEVVPIVELAKRMIRMRGLRPGTDIPIHFTGTRPGEKLHEELYEAGEQPMETAHPSITQVNSWDSAFCPDTFFERLESLTCRYFVDSSEALSELRALIGATGDVEAASERVSTAARNGYS